MLAATALGRTSQNTRTIAVSRMPATITPRSSPRSRTATADARAAAKMLVTLFPSRIVTSSLLVEPTKRFAASADSALGESMSASIWCARIRNRAVSLPEKKADSTRHRKMAVSSVPTVIGSLRSLQV